MLFLPVTVHVEVSRRVEIIPIRASSAIRPELRHMTSRLSAAPTELLGPSLESLFLFLFLTMTTTATYAKPSSTGNLSQTWAFLEEGVDHIMTKLQTGVSYSKVYCYYCLAWPSVYFVLISNHV